MAEEVGFRQHYETAYKLGSDLLHAGPAGLLGHTLDWDLEALVTGHGSLLEAVSSLYKVSELVPAELGTKLRAQSKSGNDVRQQYVEKRRRDRSDRSTLDSAPDSSRASIGTRTPLGIARSGRAR